MLKSKGDTRKKFTIFALSLIILNAIIMATQFWYSQSFLNSSNNSLRALEAILEISNQYLKLEHSSSSAVYHHTTAVENSYYEESDKFKISIEKLKSQLIEPKLQGLLFIIQNQYLHWDNENENIFQEIRNNNIDEARKKSLSIEYSFSKEALKDTLGVFLVELHHKKDREIQMYNNSTVFNITTSIIFIILTSIFLYWVNGHLVSWADLQIHLAETLAVDKAKIETDLKSTQNQLIQAAKMTTLGEMSAGIAHEIKSSQYYFRISSNDSKNIG